MCLRGDLLNTYATGSMTISNFGISIACIYIDCSHLGSVLDFSFRVLVPESKMIQAERAKFTNVSVCTYLTFP